MPSSPKIQKQKILETAFEVLIRDGYSAINIKTIANELGCSTQPISRQFGNMEEFRKSLLEYCLEYLKTIFQMNEGTVNDLIRSIAKGYVELAYNCPNLYKYLYMSDRDGEQMGEMVRSLRSPSYEQVVLRIEKEYSIANKAAEEYLQNLEFYVHGIASYIVTGFEVLSQEMIMKKIDQASEAFLEIAKMV